MLIFPFSCTKYLTVDIIGCLQKTFRETYGVIYVRYQSIFLVIIKKCDILLTIDLCLLLFLYVC